MKPTISRIRIIVNALGWSAVLLAAFSPAPLAAATVCAVDVVIVAYCGWTLASMFYRRGR
jgi:hypothetical protein